MPRITTRILLALITVVGIVMGLAIEGSRIARVVRDRSQRADMAARYERGYRENARAQEATSTRLRLGAAFFWGGQGASDRPPAEFVWLALPHENLITRISLTVAYQREAEALRNHARGFQAAAEKAERLADYHNAIRQKYEAAAQTPWRMVPPDIPPPE